jgi:5'-nucleotidase
MDKNIIISDSLKLEKIKKSIAEGGLDDFYVFADFDRTLTTALVNGKRIASLTSILRDGNYLTPDYAGQAQALYDKYHPIEIDPKVAPEEKKKKMHEWYSIHFDLLIRSGLNMRDIEKVVDSGKIKLRDGFGEFVEILHSHNIPLVILSASGIGTDAITLCLEKAGKLSNNIFIISNAYEWDKNGNAIRVRQPVIHSLNKSGSVVSNFSFFEKIKDRKNILLLGDSIDDVDTVQGLKYDNLIKIGFLNENAESNIGQYKKVYDVVILNDGPMGYINDLLEEIGKV